MSNYTIQLLTVLVAIMIYSCGSNKSRKNSDEQQESYSFVLKDSIIIDRIGGINVYDYHSESGLFLIGDVPNDIQDYMSFSLSFEPNRSGYSLMNRKGEIISSFNNSNSGPSGFGTVASSSFIANKNRVGVLSKKGLFIYDFNGNLLSKFEALNSVNLLGFPEHQIASIGDNYIAVATPKKTDSVFKYWDKRFLISEALNIYSIKDFEKSMEPLPVTIKKFPNNEIYKNNPDVVKQSPPFMAFHHKSNTLALLHPESTNLTLFSLETGQLIKSTDLKPKYFETDQVINFKDQQDYIDWVNGGLWFLNSYNQNITSIGDYFLIGYNTQIPISKLEPIIKNENALQSDEWVKVKSEYLSYCFQLVNYDGKLISEFCNNQLMPSPNEPSFKGESLLNGKIIGGNNLDEIFVYVPNNGEVERDYELIKVFSLSRVN